MKSKSTNTRREPGYIPTHAPCGCHLSKTSRQTVPGRIIVKKDIDALFGKNPDIDTLILGCTHYPILLPKIRQYVPAGVEILSQGEIVSASLLDYLERHPEIDKRISRGGTATYLTTETADKFNHLASAFMGTDVEADTVRL